MRWYRCRGRAACAADSNDPDPDPDPNHNPNPNPNPNQLEPDRKPDPEHDLEPRKLEYAESTPRTRAGTTTSLAELRGRAILSCPYLPH